MRAAIRFLISGFVIAGLSPAAWAQSGSLPVLRGSDYRPVPPTYRNWSGFYAGGAIGYSSASGEIDSSGSSMLANALRVTALEQQFEISTWPNPQMGSNNATPWGVFMGYNWQSDNAVYGIEFGYNRTKHALSANDVIARQVVADDEWRYNITVNSAIEANVTDFATFKLRSGAVYGPVLPYLSAGLAVGRMSAHQSGTVSYPAPVWTGDPLDEPANPGAASISAARGKNGAIAWGLAAGAGFDWEVVQHVFMRAEYEYVGFAAVNDVKVSIHTARVGVGLRF
jgi:outer membrane immunogenic protein